MDLMSSATTSSATLDRTAPAERRWLVLVVAAVAQLMLVLDATIVNIALPSAQQALGFSNAGVLQHPETAWRFGLTQRVSLVVVSLVFDSVFVHQASSER